MPKGRSAAAAQSALQIVAGEKLQLVAGHADRLRSYLAPLCRDPHETMTFHYTGKTEMLSAIVVTLVEALELAAGDAVAAVRQLERNALTRANEASDDTNEGDTA